MTVAWKHPLLVAIAAFAIACQTEDQASEQGSETQPAVDEAAVRETIATKDRAWGDAAVAGDVETLVAQYAPDAVVMPPGAPRAEGTEAIRAMFTGWLGQAPPTTTTVTSDEITVVGSGDYAHATGSCADDRGGRCFPRRGRGLRLLRAATPAGPAGADHLVGERVHGPGQSHPADR